MPRRVSQTIRRRDVKENRVYDGPIKKIRNAKKNRHNTKQILRHIEDYDGDDLYDLYDEEEY